MQYLQAGSWHTAAGAAAPPALTLALQRVTTEESRCWHQAQATWLGGSCQLLGQAAEAAFWICRPSWR